MDMRLQKTNSKTYSLDTLVRNTEYKFYNMAAILMKPGAQTYGMGLVIVNG